MSTLTTEPRQQPSDPFAALLEHPQPSEQPAWLAKLQAEALESFRTQGFPGARDEHWRYTSLADVVRTVYVPVGELGVEQRQQIEQVLAEHRFGLRPQDADAKDGPELVFVNGRYEAELSHIDDLPPGVVLSGLAAALVEHESLIEKHLGKIAKTEQHPFGALNTAFFEDGAFIYVPKGVTVEKPIHLLFVSTSEDRPTITHPRVLVIAEENARVSLVKSMAGSQDGVYFSNVVTEVSAGEGAHVDHYRLQQEGKKAYHISLLQADLGANADFVSHAATIGGAITRNDLNVKLAGEQASATLNGLVIIGGSQHVDNHTMLEHAAPNCPSHELYKHVLTDRANGIFKGQIYVHPVAQKTDSKQTSRTLLLSDDAYMQSQPALEIYADDVKCTHGSTTGPVDEDMLFYIQTRGVDEEAGRHLLTYAFAADITRRIAIPGVRQRLEDYMAAQHGLPTDLRITDLGRHDDDHR